MRTEIQEKAYAKLNLSLDVTGLREDGYHEVCMVMQSVDLCDDVTITLTDDGRFTAQSNRSFIPNDERNVAVKAAMSQRASGLSSGRRASRRRKASSSVVSGSHLS